MTGSSKINLEITILKNCCSVLLFWGQKNSRELFGQSVLDRHYSIQECRTVKSKTQSTEFWMWGSQNQRPDKMTWIYSKSLNVTSFWTVKVTVKFQISRFPGYDVTAACCGLKDQALWWPKQSRPLVYNSGDNLACHVFVIFLLPSSWFFVPIVEF